MTLSQAAINGRIRKIEFACVWKSYTALTTLSMIVGTPRKSLEMAIFGQEKPTSDFRQAWALGGDLFARMSQDDKASVRGMGIDEAEAFAMRVLEARMTALGVNGKSAWLANKDKADAAEIKADAEREAAVLAAEAAAKAEAEAEAAKRAETEKAERAAALAESDTIAADAPIPVLPVAHILANVATLSDDDFAEVMAAMQAEYMARAERKRLADAEAATIAADKAGISAKAGTGEKVIPRKRTVRSLAELRKAS